MRPTFKQWGMLLALLASPIIGAAAETIEVITLKHRPAAELLPTLKPFVDEEGILTAKDTRLIIRSSLSNIAQIRQLAEQLDQPLQRLLIEVRQPLVGSRESARSGASGRINLPDGSAEISVESHRTATRDKAVKAQSIQVLEGHSAVIKAGQLVPMAKRQLRDGKAETVIEHQDVSSGFRVTPHLTGDNTVLLEIAPFSASLDSGGGGVINRQQAVTTVSGKLNEWLEISGVAERRETNTSRTYSTHQRNEQQRRLLIKVTKPD